jgi:polyhydroxybutyrate depolymerase
MKYGFLIFLITTTVLVALVIARSEWREERADENVREITTENTLVPGTYRKTIESDGQTRTYEILIPTGYDAAKATPLVFIMHGGGGDGARIMEQTKFNEKANAEGFILVAPDGVDNNWNDGRGYTARGNTTDTVTENDDVGFIKALVAEVQASYNIDDNRIYIAGVSNGAMMSQRVICEAPGIFAAVGAASGPMFTLTPETCNGTTAVIGVQGTDDPFWPIEDGNGIPEFPRLLDRNADQKVTSLKEISNIWVTKNACAVTPIETKLNATVADGTSVTHYVYPDCAAGLPVEYYVVTGMGHGWPPYQGTKLAGPASQNLNTTDIFWDFFKQQSKDATY